MIKLYYHPSPNPAKVALFLEEAGLKYEVVPVDTRKTAHVFSLLSAVVILFRRRLSLRGGIPKVHAP